MLQDYKIHCEERKEQGIPPLLLSAQQTSELVELLKSEHQESELLLELEVGNTGGTVGIICTAFSGSTVPL